MCASSRRRATPAGPASHRRHPVDPLRVGVVDAVVLRARSHGDRPDCLAAGEGTPGLSVVLGDLVRPAVRMGAPPAHRRARRERRKRLFLTELLAGALALGFSLIAGRSPARTGLPACGDLIFARAACLPGDPARARHRRRGDGLAAHGRPDPVHRPVDRDGRGDRGIALGVTLPIGMVAGLLIGLGSGAIMHLLLGSPAGR